MTTLSQQSACPDQTRRRGLRHMFGPVSCDLQAVEECLANALGSAQDAGVRDVIDFLLASPGKRLRPALALLSAAATRGSSLRGGVSVEVAAAVELIHMASLVHDDLIDGATTRHRRASINARWGRGMAVALGDYLCSHAMAMIAGCGDPRVFAILGSELSAMCEGELLQVAGRPGFSLSERSCLAVVEKKTASLFGACCEAGASVAAGEPSVCEALRQFGFHFGVAFQILDDCRDLLSDEQELGKTPGQDLLAGDVTLPLLYGMRYDRRHGGRPLAHGWDSVGQGELTRIREAFRCSEATGRIRQFVGSHIGRARTQLESVRDSDFKESLRQLADHMSVSLSEILTR